MSMPENFIELLERHRECTPSLLLLAREMKASELECSTSPEAARIRRMVSSVRREIHNARSFVRLTPIGDSVLYGFLKTEHRVGDMVAAILARRFPGTLIVLGNSESSWGARMNENGIVLMENGEPLDSVVKQLRESIGDDIPPEDIESLWESYYRSQYDPRRRNLQLFRSRMTASALRNTRNRVEANTSGSTLDDFLQ